MRPRAGVLRGFGVCGERLLHGLGAVGVPTGLSRIAGRDLHVRQDAGIVNHRSVPPIAPAQAAFDAVAVVASGFGRQGVLRLPAARNGCPARSTQ